MRLRRQTSHRTEASYLHYIVEFIRFHGKRHARELRVGEILHPNFGELFFPDVG